MAMPHIQPRIVRLLTPLAAALLLNGALALSPTTAQFSGLTAHAQQAISDAEVLSYATSVLAMNDARAAALSSVQELLARVNLSTAEVDLSCTNTRELGQLPRQVRGEVRQLVVNFCNQAGDIVENSGLTVERFNTISEAHRSDPALAERIRNAINQLQQR